MAKTLVGHLTAPFAPKKFHDTYRENIERLIEEKHWSADRRSSSRPFPGDLPASNSTCGHWMVVISPRLMPVTGHEERLQFGRQLIAELRVLLFGRGVPTRTSASG